VCVCERERESERICLFVCTLEFQEGLLRTVIGEGGILGITLQFKDVKNIQHLEAILK